jgi:O-antigen ligase
MINQRKFFSVTSFRVKRTGLMVGLIMLLVAAEIGVGTELLIRRPYLLLIPLAPVFLGGLSARREGGVVFLIVIMMTLRVGFSTGTASTVPLSLLFPGLLVGLWLIKMTLDRNIRFLPSGLNLPSIIFLALVILSMFWSRFFLDPQVIITDRFFTVQLGTIGVTLFSILLCIFCFNVVRQPIIVKICYWLSIAGSLWYLPTYFIESLHSQSSDVTSTADVSLVYLSRLVNTAGLFPMWICAITLALLLFCRDLSKWQRFFMVLALSGWLFRLFILTIARVTGWLPTLIALMVVVLIYSRKWFLVVCLIGAILICLNFQFVYDAVVVTKQQEGTLDSATSRDKLWSQAFKVALLHPILGTGPAGYANYYMTYYRDLALSTHNNYLDMLLQYGILGLTAFLWLCLSIIKELWKFSKLHLTGTFDKAFTLGAFAGACGMLPAMWLGDWVIPFAYNQTIAGFNYTGYSWLFIGLALALGYMQKEKQAQPPSKADN